MCELIDINTNYGTTVQVADIKRTYIEAIINNASMCSAILEIVLFGSALENRCTQNSDIDIAIISKCTVDGLCKNKSYAKFMDILYDVNLSQEYDRLYLKPDEIEKNKYTIPVCKELAEKGKVIYRRAI